MTAKRLWTSLAALILALSASTAFAESRAPSISAEEWRSYTALFVDGQGRVIDNANGDISHSESQGYGLLLAFLAGQTEDFERIWRFTRSELLVRDDGLAAWKWDPAAAPHIQDMNNATDGDILIAYALARAGEDWGKSDYLKTASRMASAILAKTVVAGAGRTLLLPGVEGFSAEDRPDGPVVNPSYFIFEAFPLLDALAPSARWARLEADSLDLVRLLQFGPAKLPPEWASLALRPRPADGFDAQFAYNAVRIPLYLLRTGIADADLLQRFETGMSGPDGLVSVIDLKSGRVVEPLNDPGYQIIGQALACVTRGEKLPEASKVFNPTFYYPATLQLLTLSYLRENRPDCL